MYEELVKQCRGCLDSLCGECKYEHLQNAGNFVPCMNALLREAANAIEVLSKTEKTTRWIPVTERLPELNVPCLVYNKSQPTMVGWRIDDKRFRILGSYLPDHPTHRMPLPKPPKEGE